MASAGAIRAEHYHRARPPYSIGVADWVTRWLGQTRPAVADIGCGTGLSTAALAGIAGRLVAVEPDPGMRAVAQAFLAQDVEIRAGSAERTGLDDDSIDLVVAASCFEWFRPTETATEWRRVLRRRGGHVLLLWNHRATIDDASQAWDRLWTRHLGPRLGPGPEDIECTLVPRFLDGAIHRFAGIERHTFDAVRLRRFILSSAHAARLTASHRWQAVEQDIQAFIAMHGVEGQIELPFQTVGYLGIIRSPA